MKIKRVAKSFTDLQTTLKLAVSSNKAPDIVEANQGRPIMGQLVKGGLLKPLDAYADAYGWKDRWSKTLLDLNRFSADGKTFGAGNLYGVSQQGEIVGVFYNKDKVDTVPSTFAEFEAMLAKAKKAGEIPISFGNLDKFGGIHEFQTVQNQFADKQATRDFVFAKGGASFDTAENQRGRDEAPGVGQQGLLHQGLQRHRLRPGLAAVHQGQGPVHDRRHLDHHDAFKALGLKLGFFLMPGREAGATRSRSAARACRGRSRRSRRTPTWRPPTSTSSPTPRPPTCRSRPATCRRRRRACGRSRRPRKDIFTAWKDLNDSDGLTPYMDYATPTFYDDFSGAVQKLMAGKLTPDAFTKSVQEDYAKFTDTL